MKILVFGHSGQVATELRALDSDDIQINALARADDLLERVRGSALKEFSLPAQLARADYRLALA